ncbi:hypothetical protein [Sorangium sp. So ce362]|uniref:hypothetical protein n=1 Tax=Sorangium sp. So ce362 TaxID=3133303 RepID=UPI003F63F017
MQAQTKGFFSSVPDPWEHTSHAFGFLPPAVSGSGLVDVKPASQIKADPTLQDARIAVRLDRLRVAAYPGPGQHCMRRSARRGSGEAHRNEGCTRWV